jgi:hypothetical protein
MTVEDVVPLVVRVVVLEVVDLAAQILLLQTQKAAMIVIQTVLEIVGINVQEKNLLNYLIL